MLSCCVAPWNTCFACDDGLPVCRPGEVPQEIPQLHAEPDAQTLQCTPSDMPAELKLRLPAEWSAYISPEAQRIWEQEGNRNMACFDHRRAQPSEKPCESMAGRYVSPDAAFCGLGAAVVAFFFPASIPWTLAGCVLVSSDTAR